MITTTHGQGEASRRLRPWRAVSALLALLLLSACSNSKLIIAPLYNRLDDRIRDEFHKLGDFSPEQTDALEQAIGTFHVWHRQSELPRYATLLSEMADSIAQSGATSAIDVQNWMQQLEGFVQAARQCYPTIYMTGTIRTLTDEQLDFIENHYQNKRLENRERFGSRTPVERVNDRLERFEKWLARAQLQIDDEQRETLRNSLGQQISLSKQYRALTDQWNRQLFDLAREQDAPDYESRLRAHLASKWSLLETHYPDQWQANQELWLATALELISSLSTEQRRQFSRWMSTMANTLQSVSRDEPSFQPGTDPSVGCLLEPVAFEARN